MKKNKFKLYGFVQGMGDGDQIIRLHSTLKKMLEEANKEEPEYRGNFGCEYEILIDENGNIQPNYIKEIYFDLQEEGN